MFKKFVERIAGVETKEQLWNVFYGEEGIDRSFQKGILNWKEHQMLLKLIEKMDRFFQD